MINIHLCAFCWNFKVVLFYLKADVDHCFCCFGIGELEISELCSSSNNRTRFEASGIKNNERGNPNSKIVACGYLEHSHKLFSNRFRFAADFFCSPFYVPVVYTRFAIFFKDFSLKNTKSAKSPDSCDANEKSYYTQYVAPRKAKARICKYHKQDFWKCVSIFHRQFISFTPHLNFGSLFLLDMIQRS